MMFSSWTHTMGYVFFVFYLMQLLLDDVLKLATEMAMFTAASP